MLKRSKNLHIIIYLAVVGLLVFLYLLGWLKPVESVAQGISNPIMKRAYSLGSALNNLWGDNYDCDNIIKENQRLKAQLANTIQQDAQIKELTEENEILRDFLGFLKRNEYEYVMANLISRGGLDSGGSRKEFMIDQGSKQGIEEGFVVIDHNGIIVGKVHEVKSNTALVLTANNKHCKFAVTLNSREATNGVSFGDIGSAIKMSYIPQSTDIAAGDIAASSGLEKNVPKGLVLGRVNEVLKDSNEVWQEAIIEPLADYDNLIFVSVLKPKESNDY